MQSSIFSASAVITVALAPFVLYLVIITAGASFFRFRRRQGQASASGWAGKFFIVIPAHDEAGCIAETVTAMQSALSQSPSRFSIWVVADNCSDNTAALAAKTGATVLERRDPLRRGKGHALSFFFSHLLAQPDVKDDDATVVIDADTRVDPGLLTAFASRLSAGEDWLQGVSGISNPGASWRTRLMSCAFALINGTWLMGQDGLGRSVSLRGNGMCFSIRGLRRVPWAAFGLAEDIEYSWTLRLARERVRFVPDARVFSEIATTNPIAVRMQRQRWESGRKNVSAKFSYLILRPNSLRLSEKLFCLIELHMPTLTNLFGLFGLAAGATWLTRTSDGPGPFVLGSVHAGSAVILVSYLLTPYWFGLLPARFALYLCYSPLFMVWKFELLFRRPSPFWTRTAREPGPAHEGRPAREGRTH